MMVLRKIIYGTMPIKNLTKEQEKKLKITKKFLKTKTGKELAIEMGYYPPTPKELNEKTTKLTKKQLVFAKEYLKTGNGAKSAIRAGYSAKSARAIASENLTKPDIQTLIKKEREEALRKCGVNALYIVKGFKDIYETNNKKIPLVKIIVKNGEVKAVPIKDREGNPVDVSVHSFSAIKALKNLKDIANLKGKNNKNLNLEEDQSRFFDERE